MLKRLFGRRSVDESVGIARQMLEFSSEHAFGELGAGEGV